MYIYFIKYKTVRHVAISEMLNCEKKGVSQIRCDTVCVGSTQTEYKQKETLVW